MTSPLAIVLAIALVAAGSPVHAVEVGDVPPDYLGKTNKGGEARLSESTGSIRIVTFWATWCPPCMKELPVLNAIQKHGGSERIKVIAINLRESKKQFRKALRAFKDYELDFVHDQRGTVSKRYSVKGIPHMLIIDTDGHVAFQHFGYTEDDLEEIVADINSLLLKMM